MEPPRLHSLSCFICHKPTDAPHITLYNHHINDRVALCAKICLTKYNYLAQSIKMIADDPKKNERRKST